MKKVLLLLAIFSSVMLNAINLTPETTTLLQKAKSETKGITAQELAKHIKANNVVVIDIRTAAEIDNGEIKTDKLIKLPRGFLEIKYPKLILEKYTKNDSIVVYCGIEPRSVFAAARLKELGFTNVKYLVGGFKNWKAEGLETFKAK